MSVISWIFTAIMYPEKWLYASRFFPTNRLNLPDFLGIGAQKAGTTWLYENLRHHPEVYMPERKELHYFDREFHKPLVSYSHYFLASNRCKKGEITPAYSILSRSRIRFIHRIVPSVKLIFLMRDPVDRAWSQALMNLVTLPGRRIEEVGEDEFIEHIKSPRSMKRGDYISILENWLSSFPQEQLFLGRFEDIQSRPQELLQEVFLHIGVSEQVDWKNFPFNSVILKGVDVPIPPLCRELLEAIYLRDREMIASRFGFDWTGN